MAPGQIWLVTCFYKENFTRTQLHLPAYIWFMGTICAKIQEVWNQKIWPIKHEIFIIWSYSESLLTSKLELVWLQVRKPTQIVFCSVFSFSHSKMNILHRQAVAILGSVAQGWREILLAFPSMLQCVKVAATTAITSTLQARDEKAVWNAQGLNKEKQLFQQARAIFCLCLIHLLS